MATRKILKAKYPPMDENQKLMGESRESSDETTMSTITWNTTQKVPTNPQFFVYVFKERGNYIIKTVMDKPFQILGNIHESSVMEESMLSGLSQEDILLETSQDESSGNISYSSTSTGNTFEIIHDIPYEEKTSRDFSDVTDNSQDIEMVNEKNGDVDEKKEMELEESVSKRQDSGTDSLSINQSITVGGYVMKIQDLVKDMADRVTGDLNEEKYNYAKSWMVDYLTIHKQYIPETVDYQSVNPSDIYVIMALYLTTVYKNNLGKTNDSSSNLTGDDIVYQSYLSFIENIPMSLFYDSRDLDNVVIDPMYIEHGREVEEDVEITIESEAGNDPESQENTKRGGAGGIKFQRLRKKEYQTIKPWLEKLPTTPETGELFNEFLTKTRAELNIKAKEIKSSGNPPIVTLLKNMMLIITSTYKLKSHYTPPDEGGDMLEDEETVKKIYDSFLYDDDGDPYVCKIVADMLSIFMYLVIFCISNREPTIDNFYVELRTVYIKSIDQPPNTKYKGVDILFEGCAIDSTQKPPLYWENYFNTDTEASTFIANFPEITNQLLLSSPVSNKYNSPLTGGLVALLSRNLVKNKLLKLVCYDSTASKDINKAGDDDEIKSGSVAPRTCIMVDVPNMVNTLTSITGLTELAGNPLYSTLSTIITSNVRYEFMNLLLKYSITQDMVETQIELLESVFGEEFIQMIKNLMRKIMIFYADTGMCTLQGDEGNEYANFIYDNTYDNPDNRSINYRFMYSNIYTKLHSLQNVVTMLLSDKEMEILLSTYIIRTPVTGGSGHFQQNWTPSFNRLITDVYYNKYSGTGDGEMGKKVSLFNREHEELIGIQLQPPTAVYTTTYSDKTNTYGIVLDNLTPEFSTWLDLKSVNCSFGNFLSYIRNNTPNGVCNVNSIFSLRKFVLVCLTEDIYHDSKPSTTRVNKENSNVIKAFVNIALNFYNQSSDSTDPINNILSKAKLPNKTFTPHKDRTYEQQCYGETLSDINYEKIMGPGMDKKRAEDIVKLADDSRMIFKYNNAVMKQYKMENSGNSATFVDGGTLKQTENILIPNLCLCIHGNENDTQEQNDKFYIVVSYVCKEITPGVRNIIMRINLIYVSGSDTTMFVVHEFVLGKGVHCKEIYNDLVHSTPIKTKFNGLINTAAKNITTVFPILFCLKKTCCDLFQNILKCSAHVKVGDSYEILGFFKKIPTPLLDTITNKDIAATIVMETDIKELLVSRSLNENCDITKPLLIPCKYDGDGMNVVDAAPHEYFELFNIQPDTLLPLPPQISSTTSSTIATPTNAIPTYSEVVELLTNDYDNPILMSNIRWAIINNPVNIETFESLFLSCLYWEEIKIVVTSLVSLPVNVNYPLLTKQYLVSLFTKYTSVGTFTDSNISARISELNSDNDMYRDNRFNEPYKMLFWNLHLYIISTINIDYNKTPLIDIDQHINYFNQHLITNLIKITNEASVGCETPAVSLFTYNNILWEFFRPRGKSNFRNIDTISNESASSLQIAITGDIMDSLFALMIVSLSPKLDYSIQNSNIAFNIVGGMASITSAPHGGKTMPRTRKRRTKLYFITKKRYSKKKYPKSGKYSKTKKQNKMKSKSSKNKK